MYQFALNKTYNCTIGSRLLPKACCTTTFFFGLIGFFCMMPICIQTLLHQSQKLFWRSGTWLTLLSSFFTFHPPLFHIPWLSNSEKYSDPHEQEWLHQNLAYQPGRVNSAQAVLILNSESFSHYFQSALCFCSGGSGPAVGPPGKGCSITEQKRMILVPGSLKPHSENIS